MPQEPQRPFVPHRTPKTARPTVRASEFRLYRPFVPGDERDAVESIAPTGAAIVLAAQSAFSPPIRSIADFLDTSPAAVAAYPQERRESSYAIESVEEPDELPPVEHFLDPLPIVEHFAPDSEGALSDAWPTANDAGVAAGGSATDVGESGWIETDWQGYDWRSAAALGEGPDAEASNAWASTDWDGTAAPTRDPRPTAAQAIASALDQIAQRIREGELAVPGSSAISDPTKIAATLAALLGVRR